MRFIRVTAPALAACLLSSSVAGGAWTLEPIAAGRPGSLAIDAEGRPHVTFRALPAGLWYARGDSSGWDYHELTDTGSGAERFALKLDADGEPHVTYPTVLPNGLPAGLHYTDWRGSGFAEPHDDVKLGSAFGAYAALALTTAGEPRIAYQDMLAQDLWYATGTWTGSGWSWTNLNLTPEIEHPGGHGAYSSIALDSSDSPAIAYLYDDTGTGSGPENWKLGYGRYAPGVPQADANGWILEVADPHPYSGVSASLVLDSGNQPRILHVDWQDEELRYTRWTEAVGWVTQVLDAFGAVSGAYLVLDSQDREHIAYETGGTIKYAAWTGADWEISTVGPGYLPRLALDAQDHPRILFQQGYGSDAIVVYAVPEPGCFSLLVAGGIALRRRTR